jgi:hypothetical protein
MLGTFGAGSVLVMLGEGVRPMKGKIRPGMPADVRTRAVLAVAWGLEQSVEGVNHVSKLEGTDRGRLTVGERWGRSGVVYMSMHFLSSSEEHDEMKLG